LSRRYAVDVYLGWTAGHYREDMKSHTTRLALLLGALASVAVSTPIAGGGTRQVHSTATVVSPAKAHRIAAVWGGSLTFVPTWAPSGVVPSHWWSETCACGTDDNRLVVQFSRHDTRLDWEVTDTQEFDRVRAGVVCHGGKSPARVVDGHEVFYRAGTDTAWTCLAVPPGARWYPSVGNPGIAPVGRLIVSVRQVRGRAGRLRPAELQRMVASAQRSSSPGRTSPSRYELPSESEIRRMALAFRQPLFLPTRLPGGFIYSDWRVAAQVEPQVDPRRQVSVGFGRDSLFEQILWDVSSGVDRLGLECQRKDKLRPQSVINGRAIYANEGIHGVSVWTCFAPETVGTAKPLEVSMWYDIRLHNSEMLRLAMRMVGTAKLTRIR
jgi:hypothetical protein